MSGSPFWREPSSRNTYRSNPCHCPHCGYRVDAHDSMDGGGPGPNAVSVCLQCCQPAMYVIAGDTISLRVPTADELRDIEATPDYQLLRERWHATFGPRGPRFARRRRNS